MEGGIYFLTSVKNRSMLWYHCYAASLLHKYIIRFCVQFIILLNKCWARRRFPACSARATLDGTSQSQQEAVA